MPGNYGVVVLDNKLESFLIFYFCIDNNKQLFIFGQLDVSVFCNINDKNDKKSQNIPGGST
jgi:hypothetical protein